MTATPPGVAPGATFTRPLMAPVVGSGFFDLFCAAPVATSVSASSAAHAAAANFLPSIFTNLFLESFARIRLRRREL